VKLRVNKKRRIKNREIIVEMRTFDKKVREGTSAEELDKRYAEMVYGDKRTGYPFEETYR
jgi:ribosomal protein S20